ncbi:MAG: hypothetical protein SGPRY_011608 [Prymnesium sp.]
MQERIADVGRQIEAHKRRQKSTAHVAKQEKNATALAMELFTAQEALTRGKLKGKRQALREHQSHSVAEKEAAEQARAAVAVSELKEEHAESIVEQAG